MNPVTFGLGAQATFLVTLGFGIGTVPDRPGTVCIAAGQPGSVRIGAGLGWSVTVGSRRVTCDTEET